MALGPPEVHPEEHLGPVGRLGAACARADRDDGVLRVVVAGEQEERSLALELPPEQVRLALDVGRRLGVRRLLEEVDELDQVGGSLLERAPEGDLLAQALGLADDLLGSSLVVPEPGLDRPSIELRYAFVLGSEVKDAPRSTGSAPPGPGSLRRPSAAHLDVLEQDRTELDQPKGRLAPGDDGVHAGTVAVVGTDAAVAITVEGGGVTAGAAVPFTGNQVHELGFLSLLHKLPLSCPSRVGRA
jgi:hypothetical protein